MKKSKANFLLEAIVSILAKQPKGRVLDLGCGDGECARRLQDLGFEVMASDMDQDRFKYHGSIKFTSSNLDSPLPFADGSFDYVIFMEVIEHIYNPSFVIGQISRVLKPSGIVVLSTPNILNVGSRLRFLFEGGFDFFREPALDYQKVFPSGLQNMHIVVWRYHELEYLLFQKGLKVEFIRTDLIKASQRILALLLYPLFGFQRWQKESRSRRKGGVDYRRINNLLLSKELLCGRHLILGAKKVISVDGKNALRNFNK